MRKRKETKKEDEDAEPIKPKVMNCRVCGTSIISTKMMYELPARTYICWHCYEKLNGTLSEKVIKEFGLDPKEFGKNADRSKDKDK